MSFRTTNGSEKSLIEHIEQNISRDKSIFHFEYLPKTACWGVNSEGFLPSVEMTWLEHSSFDLFGVHKIALFYQNENCCILAVIVVLILILSPIEYSSNTLYGHSHVFSCMQ